MHQAAFPSVKTSQMASTRNFFLRRVRLTNIKDALTHFPLRFNNNNNEYCTVSILANDTNRDCTGQYHFRSKISKSDQKEKDERKHFFYFFPVSTRGWREAGAKVPHSDHPPSTWCIRPRSLPARRNTSNVAYLELVLEPSTDENLFRLVPVPQHYLRT